MSPAKFVRLEKEIHPSRFCPDSKCFWRVTHPGRWDAGISERPDTPCPKHMKNEIGQIVRGSKVRRIDEPYVVLHVRELDSEGINGGMPKALCFNSFGHGKWMLLTDLEAAS